MYFFLNIFYIYIHLLCKKKLITCFLREKKMNYILNNNENKLSDITKNYLNDYDDNKNRTRHKLKLVYSNC